MKNGWIIKGDFFRLWSSSLLSSFSAALFFYSLIWWAITDNEKLLTGSLIIAIGAAVSLILSPFSGWLADKYHRGKLLAIVDVLLFFFFVVLVVLSEYMNTESGLIVLLCRIIISTGSGSTDSIARSLLLQTINEENLKKALGFQESLGQISHLIAPAVAGFLVYYLGISGIWIICALLYEISAVLEFFLTDKASKNKAMKFTGANLFYGYSRLKSIKSLRLLLYGTSVQQLMFSGFAIYIAVWSTFVLGHNQWISGSLQAFWGIGTFIGALLVAFVLKIKKVKKACVIVTLLIGLLLAPLGFIDNLGFAITMLGLTGLLSGVLNVYLESHLQDQTTEEYRGREISAFFAINNALMPLGYALAGVIAELIPLQFLFLVVASPVPLVAWFVYRSFSVAEVEEDRKWVDVRM